MFSFVGGQALNVFLFWRNPSFLLVALSNPWHHTRPLGCIITHSSLAPEFPAVQLLLIHHSFQFYSRKATNSALNERSSKSNQFPLKKKFMYPLSALFAPYCNIFHFASFIPLSHLLSSCSSFLRQQPIFQFHWGVLLYKSYIPAMCYFIT